MREVLRVLRCDSWGDGECRKPLPVSCIQNQIIWIAAHLDRKTDLARLRHGLWSAMSAVQFALAAIQRPLANVQSAATTECYHVICVLVADTYSRPSMPSMTLSPLSPPALVALTADALGRVFAHEGHFIPT
jgi:hypothetical protein